MKIKRLNMRAWLELVRVPNLPTVPGDVLAGGALAAVGLAEVSWLRVLPVVVSSLLLYMAGLIWNDCADYDEDCKERPDRPLPSGRIERRRAATVGGRLAAFGVGLAWFVGVYSGLLALALLLLVIAYNFGSRQVRWLGFVNMGACRGASLLLGASAVRHPMEWPVFVVVAAAGIALYIVGVAWLAVDETKRKGSGVNIGFLIRLLIPIQAGLCMSGGGGGIWIALLVLLGWPVSSWLGQRFYAS